MSEDAETFLDGSVRLYCGDCLDVIKTLADNSVDAVVTDPPYSLVSIVKRFANSPRSERTENTENPYGRTGRGFMGQRWDNGAVAFAMEFWAEVLRVLKPGGHVVAFGGTRTYHRLACAIEDAGFEIRDQLGWCFGSGFPKSHDVSKGIDKAAGARRNVVGISTNGSGPNQTKLANHAHGDTGVGIMDGSGRVFDITAPATDKAREWQGWGTALKPAWEPICLARKPLSEATVAANVLRWGTGAINIDGCRIGDFNPDDFAHGIIDGILNGREGEASANRRYVDKGVTNFAATPGPRGGSPIGRWPANLCHDGSPEVVSMFPQSDGQNGLVDGQTSPREVFGEYGPRPRAEPRDGSGSAARFFFSSKADSDDRLASKHPTVKPVGLMQWLSRLVTPPGGTILDLFAGTGTTGEAAWREGFRAILIEREAAYQDDIRRRMGLVLRSKDGRRYESAKAKAAAKGHGPLFDGVE